MEDFKHIVLERILPFMTWLLLVAVLAIVLYIFVTHDVPGIHPNNRVVDLIIAVLSGLLSLFFGGWRLKNRFGRKCKDIAVFMNRQRKTGERANVLYAQGRRSEATMLLEQSRANCEKEINDLAEYNAKLDIFHQQNKIAYLKSRLPNQFRLLPRLRKDLI